RAVEPARLEGEALVLLERLAQPLAKPGRAERVHGHLLLASRLSRQGGWPEPAARATARTRPGRTIAVRAIDSLARPRCAKPCRAPDRWPGRARPIPSEARGRPRSAGARDDGATTGGAMANASDSAGRDAARPRELEGRIALVTGASRGIGRAVARALAAAGARVACVGTRPESTKQVVQEIRAAGGEAAGFAARTEVPGEVQALFDAV